MAFLLLHAPSMIGSDCRVMSVLTSPGGTATGRTPQTRASHHSARRAGLEFSLALADRGYVLEKGAGSPCGTCRASARRCRTAQPAVRTLTPRGGQAQVQPSFRFSSADCRTHRRMNTSRTAAQQPLSFSLELCHASHTGFSYRTRVCDPLHGAHDLQCHPYSGAAQSD